MQGHQTNHRLYRERVLSAIRCMPLAVLADGVLLWTNSRSLSKSTIPRALVLEPPRSPMILFQFLILKDCAHEVYRYRPFVQDAVVKIFFLHLTGVYELLP